MNLTAHLAGLVQVGLYVLTLLSPLAVQWPKRQEPKR